MLEIVPILAMIVNYYLNIIKSVGLYAEAYVAKLNNKSGINHFILVIVSRSPDILAELGSYKAPVSSPAVLKILDYFRSRIRYGDEDLHEAQPIGDILCPQDVDYV